MCPEQAQGQKPDCRGDIYSLACVAYFLLSGRAPFEDDNPVMLVVAHSSAIPPTFDEIGVNVPRDLASIVMRCLAKDPYERFQSPRELQNALDRCTNAWDWTWANAEDWWLDHPEETYHQIGERGSTVSETTSADDRLQSEQDVTFVSDGRILDDSSF
jgi:serine/threonine-protein kinase